jgi:hypothetical protein
VSGAWRPPPSAAAPGVNYQTSETAASTARQVLSAAAA